MRAVGVLVKITPHDFLVMAAMVALMSAGVGFMLGRAMVAMVLVGLLVVGGIRLAKMWKGKAKA